MTQPQDESHQSAEKDTNSTQMLVGLSIGHTLIHWFQQLWPVIIPSVKATLGINDVQLGTLSSIKQFTTGPLMLPSGMLADFYRKQTSGILAAAFIFLGISHSLVGLSSTFAWIIPGVALLGIGTALWHPAALGSISLRFPERRATALAVHGVGASIGDTIAPIIIGLVLITMSWQNMLHLHLIPAFVIALILWQFLSKHYRQYEGTRPSFASYLEDAKNLLRSRVVLAIIGVNVLTGMSRLTIMTFLPIYIQQDLGYSTLGLGFFWGLLHMAGAISQPVMGYLSDRFGRKAVLLPSLVIFGLLYLALAYAESGLHLILVIGALGLFFYALATVTMATVMDVASEQVQASTMGITSLFTQFITLPSPILAGWLVTKFGTPSSFLYSGALTLASAALLAVIRVPRSSRPTPKILG